MTAFLKTLLVLTVAGTLCGLFLVALRKLSKGKIPSSFLYFAWIVVVLRFAIPINGLIPVGSSVSPVDLPKPSYTEPYTEPQQFPHGDGSGICSFDLFPHGCSGSARAEPACGSSIPSS